jgi:hypothetical protein
MGHRRNCPVLYLFSEVLGIELRGLCMLGKGSTTGLHPQPRKYAVVNKLFRCLWCKGEVLITQF